MSRVDLMPEEEEDYDSDEGAILWNDDETAESGQGSTAQASLTALGEIETARKGKASEGRRFDHMKRLFGMAELEELETPHTIVAFRDSGYDALAPNLKESLHAETERAKARTATVMASHVLDGYVSDDFLDGSTGEREAVFDTLDPEAKMRILPPRVPKSLLPAGARVEEPILRLETPAGKLLKQTTARRTFDRTSPNDPFQQVIVVSEPLVKWARSRKA